ncbi:MAG: hypothetical protein AAFQ98_27185, partial [Bacteroidota bacterium]
NLVKSPDLGPPLALRMTFGVRLTEDQVYGENGSDRSFTVQIPVRPVLSSPRRDGILGINL